MVFLVWLDAGRKLEFHLQLNSCWLSNKCPGRRFRCRTTDWAGMLGCGLFWGWCHRAVFDVGWFWGLIKWGIHIHTDIFLIDGIRIQIRNWHPSQKSWKKEAYLFRHARRRKLSPKNPSYRRHSFPGSAPYSGEIEVVSNGRNQVR